MFLIREGWGITFCVLAYVVLMTQMFGRWRLVRLIVPLLISFALHTIRFRLYPDVDIVKYISDAFYDFFAPIGIYRVAMLIHGRRELRKQTGEPKTRKGAGR